MSTTIKVDAVTKEPRIWQNKTTWGVKRPNGDWVTFYRDKKPERGEVLDVNITERNVKGRIYVDAFPVMPPLAPPEMISSNGTGPKVDDTWSWDNGKKMPWEGCIVFAKAAHELALELEPDKIGPETDVDGNVMSTGVTVDRSTARAAILNTLMIAYTGGKILVAKEEDDYVAPAVDDDIPPF